MVTLLCNCDAVAVCSVFTDVVTTPTAVGEEDPFTFVICVIIRVTWRIRKDDCILILRKACGKKDKKGFVQSATEEMEQIATLWKVSLSRLALFFIVCFFQVKEKNR